MATERNNWESDSFRKDPYRMPEGYFEDLGDRIIARMNRSEASPLVKRRTRVRPLIAWVSGIAAIFVMAWFGLQELYLKPHQELSLQENLLLFADYFGEELNEGQLAGFVADYSVDVNFQTSVDYHDLIDAEQESAEEFIYESIIF